MGPEAALVVGIISLASGLLLKKLDYPLLQKFGSILGIEGEVKELKSTLDVIVAFLKDHENNRSKSHSLELLLKEVEAELYNAENVLDKCEYCVKEWELKDIKVGKFVSGVNPFPSRRRELATEIHEVHTKLKKIAEMRDLFSAEAFSSREIDSPSQARMTRETSSFFIEPHFTGRDREMEIIREWLLGEGDIDGRIPSSSSAPKLSNPSVLPIIGCGGIGKTALVRRMYNNQEVRNYFSLRMWVCVSDNFDVKRLIKQIIESASGETCDLVSLNALQNKLSKKLEGKKFLLVVDDIWEGNDESWDLLQSCLSGKIGSKLIATTRNEKATTYMETTTGIHLEGLPLNESESLLKAYVFPSGDVDASLEDIGKQIVKKMCGSPLAIKTIAANLVSKKDAVHWTSILESEIWELRKENNILPVLNLSYQLLPSCLQKCFAYCGLFPKAYVFDKKRLIYLWMAQGFLSTPENTRMEEVGEDYFDELCWRSFLEPSYSRDKYVMHDLFHDIARYVSKGTHLKREGDDVENVNPVEPDLYHLSLCTYKPTKFKSKNFSKLTKLRSLFFLARRMELPIEFGKGFSFELEYLRVLDLSRSGIKKLPESIGKLILLRYLNLSYTAILELPNSISKLYGLLVLDLEGCNRLEKIPNGVASLVKMRHLIADPILVSNICGIGHLTSLQELEVFNVQNKKGLMIKELKEMCELRGYLCLNNLRKVKTKQEAYEAALKEKKYLQKLELRWPEHWEWDEDRCQSEANHEGEVLEALQPPPNLQKLTIRGNGGLVFSGWIESQPFMKLKKLSLLNCRNWVSLPILGQFKYLESLKLKCMHKVKIVGNELYGNGGTCFPSLLKLSFYDMLAWENWSEHESLQCFPKLKSLKVDKCPVLKEIVLPPSLQHLEILNCPVLKEIVLPPSLQHLEILNCPILSYFLFQKRSFLSTIRSSIVNSYHTVSDWVKTVPFKVQHFHEWKVKFVEEWKPRIRSEFDWKSDIYIIRDCLDIELCKPWLDESPDFDAGLNSDLNNLLRGFCGNSNLLHLNVDGVYSLPIAMFLLPYLPNIRLLSICGTGLELASSGKLESLDIEGYANLQSIEIVGCRNLKILNFGSLDSLGTLHIAECSGLTSINFGSLDSLWTLHINACSGLTTINFGSLDSLRTLHIAECSGLTTINFGSLYSLSRLEINGCFSLQLLVTTTDGLPSLDTMDIRGCPNLESFPEIVSTSSNNPGTRSEDPLDLLKEKLRTGLSMYAASDVELNLKPFSQLKRTQPAELTGSSKVFETSAMPVFSEEETSGLEGAEDNLPYVVMERDCFAWKL